ncbi:MAG: CDP-diacylglycerol--glycerol-3-phosphate 3-phosphatidyltransferase [Gammaproteobacteria bacterium]|nr:CDP-diacylglycerol--glycerol-3-phosphate 3-phosphatidyltransferase [Gammaproteobacteria bacterium]
MKFWTLPNGLTVFRIVLIPMFVLNFYLHYHHSEWVTAGIFLVAALTDWLDGFLARYLKETSAFGAFLDPVADKLMVAVALVLLVSEYPSPWMAIPGLVIVSREILISALREWMAELGRRATVKVSSIGKIKTVAQMTALVILFSQTPGDSMLIKIGFVMMYIAVILTIWSMLIYLHAAWVNLRDIPLD